eukprot:3347481-Rhodomonas_salina.1
MRNLQTKPAAEMLMTTSEAMPTIMAVGLVLMRMAVGLQRVWVHVHCDVWGRGAVAAGGGRGAGGYGVCTRCCARAPSPRSGSRNGRMHGTCRERETLTRVLFPTFRFSLSPHPTFRYRPVLSPLSIFRYWQVDSEVSAMLEAQHTASQNPQSNAVLPNLRPTNGSAHAASSLILSDKRNTVDDGDDGEDDREEEDVRQRKRTEVVCRLAVVRVQRAACLFMLRSWNGGGSDCGGGDVCVFCVCAVVVSGADGAGDDDDATADCK